MFLFKFMIKYNFLLQCSFNNTRDGCWLVLVRFSISVLQYFQYTSIQRFGAILGEIINQTSVGMVPIFQFSTGVDTWASVPTVPWYRFLFFNIRGSLQGFWGVSCIFSHFGTSLVPLQYQIRKNLKLCYWNLTWLELKPLKIFSCGIFGSRPTLNHTIVFSIGLSIIRYLNQCNIDLWIFGQFPHRNIVAFSTKSIILNLNEQSALVVILLQNQYEIYEFRFDMVCWNLIHKNVI